MVSRGHVESRGRVVSVSTGSLEGKDVQWIEAYDVFMSS